MQKFLSQSKIAFFEKVLAYLVIFLTVLIPLLPKLPLFGVSGTFVAIRFEDIVIALSITLLGLYLVLTKQVRSFFNDPIIKAFLVFFFIGFLSVLSGYFLTHTTKIHLGLLHLFRRVEVMMLLPLGYYAFKKSSNLKGLGWTVLTVVFLVNVYALGQRYLNWPVISTTNSEFSKGLVLYLTPGARVNSTFAGHYDLAVFLMMFIVGATPVFFTLKNWLVRVTLLLNLGLSFIILVMTAARFSFVALIAGVLLSIILTGRKLLIAGVVVLAVLAIAIPSPMQDRLISTVRVFLTQEAATYTPENEHKQTRSELNIPTLPAPEATFSAEERGATPSGVASDITPGEPTDYTELTVYRSFGIRFNYEWPAAIRAFYKNPLLGTGYSSLGVATDNDFLRSLGEVGILGTISLVLVFFIILKVAWIKRRSYLSIGLFSMVLAFLLNGVFIDVLESSKVASLLWLSIGVYLAKERYRA